MDGVTESRNRFVPAAGKHWLTSAYDPLIAITMRERTWRPAIVTAILAGRPQPARILDLGCGTGSLTLAIKRSIPSADVVGVDGDPGVIARAAAKSRRQGIPVDLRFAYAQSLPFDDGEFDVVVSSLVFHHLDPDVKSEALSEIHRVLRPGGRALIADWGPPRSPFESIGFFAVQLLDGFENTREHRATGLMPRLRSERFANVTQVQSWRTAFGSLELLDAAIDSSES